MPLVSPTTPGKVKGNVIDRSMARTHRRLSSSHGHKARHHGSKRLRWTQPTGRLLCVGQVPTSTAMRQCPGRATTRPSSMARSPQSSRASVLPRPRSPEGAIHQPMQERRTPHDKHFVWDPLKHTGALRGIPGWTASGQASRTLSHARFHLQNARPHNARARARHGGKVLRKRMSVKHHGLLCVCHLMTLLRTNGGCHIDCIYESSVARGASIDTKPPQVLGQM